MLAKAYSHMLASSFWASSFKSVFLKNRVNPGEQAFLSMQSTWKLFKNVFEVHLIFMNIYPRKKDIREILKVTQSSPYL
jgi:hypothetical protein